MRAFLLAAFLAFAVFGPSVAEAQRFTNTPARQQPVLDDVVLIYVDYVTGLDNPHHHNSWSAIPQQHHGVLEVQSAVSRADDRARRRERLLWDFSS
jgi:hypothetical protein